MSDTSSPKTATSYLIILIVACTHLINDLIQFLVPALYPLFKSNFELSYLQLGYLTLAQQITACILQPVMGLYGDVRPKPLTLALSLAIVGVVLLAIANSFALLLLAAAVLGVGSALFHPEASRVSRMASGGKLGFAQSSFQVGGNTGTALSSLAVVFIVLPLGQESMMWFALLAAVAVVMLTWVARWYANHQRVVKAMGSETSKQPEIPRKTLVLAFAVIDALLLSKFVYIKTFKSFYNFFLIEKFGLEIGEAQSYLFIFLGAVALGTFMGGPIGDRLGRLNVIWVSILGALPFALLLPHMNLFGTAILSVLVGFILSSAFSAIVVYAQELMPQKVGMVAGFVFVFVFGFAFGVGAWVLQPLVRWPTILVSSYFSLLLLLEFLTALLSKVETPS